jgi:hypothetical protein
MMNDLIETSEIYATDRCGAPGSFRLEVSSPGLHLDIIQRSTHRHILYILCFIYFPPLSNLIDCARSVNDGLVSACSAQHCFIELIYSGGAVCFDTEGLSNGGGFFIFAIISISKTR